MAAWSSSARRSRPPIITPAMTMGTDVASLSWNPVSDFEQLTTFPFMVQALQAGAIVAVMAGAIGWFMVLRRQTFAGHTLSVVAFPGAAGATLVGLPLAFGYFGACAAAALALAWFSQPNRRAHSNE